MSDLSFKMHYLFPLLNLALFVAIEKNDSSNILNKHVKLHQTGYNMIDKLPHKWNQQQPKKKHQQNHFRADSSHSHWWG